MVPYLERPTWRAYELRLRLFLWINPFRQPLCAMVRVYFSSEPRPPSKAADNALMLYKYSIINHL